MFSDPAGSHAPFPVETSTEIALMKLRYSPTSPFVRKVMVAAIETGLIERIEKIPTAVTPIKPNDDVARDNPLVKVPALTTDDGLILYDSPVICEYLDSLNGGAKLFPPSGTQRSSIATSSCGPKNTNGRNGPTGRCARCAAR
jgi:hypothetical protein